MSNQSPRSREVIALARNPRRMPPNWTPPDPAWAASFDAQSTPVVMAYFGTQLAEGDSASRVHRICEFFAGNDVPSNLESASYIDRIGRRTIVSIAYWTDPARYASWNAGFERWWNDPARIHDGVGHFREVLIVPPERFETIFSNDYFIGVAKVGGPQVGPIREHGYWGSMRDRLAISSDDDLVSEYGDTMPRVGARETLGHRLRVSAPHNLAVIRSGQDWTECSGAQREFYLESIAPTLRDAMHSLRDAPNETGCCEMRFAQHIDDAGAPITKSFGHGYFLSLAHLERWAATHPKHLAILGHFMKMARDYRSELRLKLWHEVSVLPAAGQTFEYLNCHGETGLLPYFASTEF
ncbi:MAG TPA: phenylacetaldoxime dehydratase family protein [Candidatus Binataceae bacterium]|nr:phenylacetaldoxime dehydratase family protein [Candidatus Binataceae bacterium]